MMLILQKQNVGRNYMPRQQLTALLASAARRAVYRAISRCSSSSGGILSMSSRRTTLDGLVLKQPYVNTFTDVSSAA